MAKKESSKPIGFWFGFYTLFAKFYCWISGFKIDRTLLKEQVKRSKEEKKGFIVIYNHSGTKDHFILTAGLNGHKANYVLAKTFYYNKWIRLVTGWVRAIFKDQFVADLQSIRKMKRAVDRPGILTIAPAGQMTIDGGEQFVSRGIVKLIRFCKCDVLGYEIQGVHFRFPKWAKTKRKSKVTAKFVPVLRAEEIKDLTDDEIFERVCNVAVQNLQDYQEKHMNIIKGKNLASGLEGELYICPKCHAKHENYTVDDKIICKKCGNTHIYNNYGFLETVGNSVGYRREDYWNRWQQDYIKDIVKNNDDFELVGKFDLHRNLRKETVIEKWATGTIHLTKTRLYFEGVTNEGVEFTKEFAKNAVFQLPHSTALYFYIPDSEGSFKFYPVENPTIVNEFVQTIDAMREIEEENGKVF